MLRCWAVKKFVFEADLGIYLYANLQILHTTPQGGLFDQLLVQYYDLFICFYVHFNSKWPYIGHY